MAVYMVIMLATALVAFIVSTYPPLVCSSKPAALAARSILTGVVSFCTSAALTRAVLDLIQ